MEQFSPEQPEWHPQPSDLLQPEPARDRHDNLTPIERLEVGRPQLEQLVTELAPDIQAGRWDAILGDDVSGRLPALILRRVMAHAYAAQGRPAPQTYFIAMGQEFSNAPDAEYDAMMQQIKDYVSSGERPQRVLFVTDNIAGGGSIQSILEALDEAGIPCDVASVQATRDTVEQAAGHAPYSREAAEALADTLAGHGRFRTEEDRRSFVEGRMEGWGHGQNDPQARYYGVEQPVTGDVSQPFHLSKFGRPHSRAAVGVEKYGRPTTEGLRHHALRQLHDGQLQRDEAVPPNPAEAQVRQAANDMADDLYRQIVATSRT